MRALRWLWSLIVGGLAIIGLVVVLAAGAGIAYVSVWQPSAPSVPHGAVLVLDLSRPLPEAPDGALDLLLGRSSRTLRSTVETIGHAGRDERVSGIFLALGGGAPGSLVQAQELRAALAAFRASGKFVLAFAQTYDETGGLAAYYLASVADEIWLQPSGDVGMTGIAFELPFLKRALARFGVAAEVSRRKDYKSGADMVAEEALTPANREQLQALAAAWTAQVAEAVSQRRGLAPAAVRALMDRGPFLAAEARAERLVDRLGYRDEAQAEARKRAGAAGKLVPFARYHAAPAPDARSPEPTGIALIHAVGPIVPGRGGRAPWSRDRVVAADTLVAAIDSAVESKGIAAIVLRIDSPGGSYTASDAVWRAVGRARAGGKPVIASLGRIAASGGYFIAMQADRIVAQPATITGSIGVFAGKIVLADLWSQLEIGWGMVKEGEAAAMWSPNRPFTPAEQARLDRFLDRVYDDFAAKVAAGRGLSREDVERAAQGRIWSGTDALRLKLVDALGGLDSALGLAREALKLPADASVAYVDWPRERSPLEQAMELIAGDGPERGLDIRSAVDGVGALADLAALFQPLLRPLADAASADGALLARPPEQARPR